MSRILTVFAIAALGAIAFICVQRQGGEGQLQTGTGEPAPSVAAAPAMPEPPVAPVAAPPPPPVAAAPAPTRAPEPTLQQRFDSLLAGRSVEFETSGTMVDAKSRALVAELAVLLREHPDAGIRIEGHTDSRGNERVNLALSEARARAVARELEKQGIAAARLSYEGYGSSQPAADNDTEAGRRANRRVEIQVREG